MEMKIFLINYAYIEKLSLFLMLELFEKALSEMENSLTKIFENQRELLSLQIETLGCNRLSFQSFDDKFSLEIFSLTLS